MALWEHSGSLAPCLPLVAALDTRFSAPLQVMELEARGAKVVPVFAGGLDFSAPVKKYMYDPLGSGKAFVDCVISLTGELSSTFFASTFCYQPSPTSFR